MIPTLQNVFDQVRQAYLNDASIVSTGQVATNAALAGPFSAAWEQLIQQSTGASRRIEKTVYLNLPANQNIIIPSAFGLNDFSEPELIEERPAPVVVTGTATTATTPIQITGLSAPLGANGSTVEIVVTDVAETFAPWGQWFATINSTTAVSLIGSVTDGVAGTSSQVSLSSQLLFDEVIPVTRMVDLDGIPQTQLGLYFWESGRIYFTGATQLTQLRITYYSTGAAPTNPNSSLGLDGCLSVLACATAANFARQLGWAIGDSLYLQAWAPETPGQPLSLFQQYIRPQILSQQTTQLRRRQFREKRSKYGTFIA